MIKRMLFLILICYQTITFAQLGFCTGSSGAPIFFENFGSGLDYGPPLPAGVTNYTYVNFVCSVPLRSVGPQKVLPNPLFIVYWVGCVVLGTGIVRIGLVLFPGHHFVKESLLARENPFWVSFCGRLGP